MKKEWTAWRNENYSFFEKKLSELSAELSLYDLGSGAEQFKTLFHRFKYTGVDFEKFNEKTIVTDLTKTFPFSNAVADIVTLSNTLEHIPTPEQFIHECARILKPGGLLVGTVPFLLGVHQAPYDFNRYTPFQLKRFLEMAGFADVQIVSLGRQMDVYNTIELKVFDELRKTHGGLILEAIRLWRRIEMRLMRRLFVATAGEKITEGYGFSGVNK
jgi:SAM-dependent methyltransferase